jgi:hypothetical protein
MQRDDGEGVNTHNPVGGLLWEESENILDNSFGHKIMCGKSLEYLARLFRQSRILVFHGVPNSFSNHVTNIVFFHHLWH